MRWHEFIAELSEGGSVARGDTDPDQIAAYWLEANCRKGRQAPR
jgi:hypothetical protein